MYASDVADLYKVIRYKQVCRRDCTRLSVLRLFTPNDRTSTSWKAYTHVSPVATWVKYLEVKAALLTKNRFNFNISKRRKLSVPEIAISHGNYGSNL